ncbi:hypothetical protein [Nitrobacter sp. TKz-YC02]|uniref:hypothetical protein n=1 Tax=Nitrobacter sp. TKz-YC02 TaxID=3398704 RepID=UPI003CF8DAC9
MSNLEDILANEIQRQGFRTTPDAFRNILIECTGRVDDGGEFVLFPYPNEEGVRSIAIGDFIRSYRQTRPDAFTPITSQDTSQPDDGHGYSGLTASYIEENRRTKLSGKPENSHRHTGKTLEMMSEIIAARKGAVR